MENSSGVGRQFTVVIPTPSIIFSFNLNPPAIVPDPKRLNHDILLVPIPILFSWANMATAAGFSHIPCGSSAQIVEKDPPIPKACALGEYSSSLRGLIKGDGAAYKEKKNDTNTPYVISLNPFFIRNSLL
jgi:hypothetical protein